MPTGTFPEYVTLPSSFAHAVGSTVPKAESFSVRKFATSVLIPLVVKWWYGCADASKSTA